MTVTEIGHPGQDKGSPRPEPEDGGTSIGALRPVYSLRAAVPPGNPPQGGDVQKQAQAGPLFGLHGPEG